MKCPKCRSDNPDSVKFCGECGTQVLTGDGAQPGFTQTIETPVSDMTSGTLFAERYQIIEELGRGGMGKVYRALDRELNSEVALKLIRPEIAADGKTIERFKNELKLARSISHRNVGRMYELMEEKGTRFISMEYIPGEDLKSFIRRSGRLEIFKAIDIARQVCEGLSEAHGSGTVHRDLKPSNIMIDKEGNARIMDFGIARSLKAEGATGPGIMIGTPEYMSPEQVGGEESDQRADIYALGVILFEMLTGELPFTGDTPFSIGMKHKGEEPRDPRELNPGIPEGLSRIIRRCLEKDRSLRYQDAGEVSTDLDSVERETSSHGQISAAVHERPEDKKKLRPAAVAALILVLAAFAVSIVYFVSAPWLQKSGPGPETAEGSDWTTSIAVLPFADLSPQGDQAYFCDSMVEDIRGRLVKIDGLKPISRTSVVRYRNTEKSLQQIAQELNVSHILEGSIQREGDSIRVNANLIDTQTGFQLWTERYDRKIESLFAIQDDISTAIAEAMELELTPKMLDEYRARQPEDMELYEKYVQGLYFINSKYTLTYLEEDFQKALEMFDQALEIDPDFAPVYTGLAWAHFHRYQLTDDPEDIQNVMVNCEKAYDLNPSFAESNLGKGFVLFLRGEYDQAYQYFRIAMQKSPNELAVNQAIAYWYYSLGLYRHAIPLYVKAIEMSPFYTWSKFNIAWCYRGIGDLEKSGEFLRDALALNPRNPFALCYYADHLVLEGEYAEAEKCLVQAKELNPGLDFLLRMQAQLYAAKGDRQQALALFENLQIYALLEMNDKALAFMNKELEAGIHFPYLHLLRNPFYLELRADPRFQEIIQRAKTRHDELVKKYGDLLQ